MITTFFSKVCDNAKAPYRKIESDLCYDLYATSVEEIRPNVFSYGIGIRIAIKRPWWARLLKRHISLSLDVRPRSSVWKTGMILSNCTGTIDELYRGEIKAVFYKVAEGEPYLVGDRIAQCHIGAYPKFEWKEVKELSTDTERGEGGFGSTGKR